MGRDNFVPAKPNRRDIPDILGAVLAKNPEEGEAIEIKSTLSWDYGQLGDKADAAMDHTVAIKKSERRASEAIIQAGEHLIAMKDMLNHGQWRDWLGAEFAMSPDTAENMMNVARKFGNQENRNFRFLNTSVLYLLAKPSTPESAREAVVEQAANGHKVTVADAKAVISEYKPTASVSPVAPSVGAVFNTAAATVQPTPVVVREHVRQPKVVTLPTAPLSQVAIINADSRQLPGMGLDPVHLVITSPPYNVGIEYDQYDDSSADYIPLLMDVWRACYDVMVDGARIAVVVPFGVGRNPYTPFDCQIMQTLVDAGFTLRGRIVWDKNTTGNRTSWGSYRLPSSPALRDTTECIIVAHKGSDTLEIPAEHKGVDDKGTHTCWLQDGDYFMELTQDHWVVAPESAQRVGHPAPFPVELVKRLMHFYAYPGAHVLDPFAGSGTVGVAAKTVGCQATLIEVSGNYCAIATERIND